MYVFNLIDFIAGTELCLFFETVLQQQTEKRVLLTCEELNKSIELGRIKLFAILDLRKLEKCEIWIEKNTKILDPSKLTNYIYSLCETTLQKAS